METTNLCWNCKEAGVCPRAADGTTTRMIACPDLKPWDLVFRWEGWDKLRGVSRDKPDPVTVTDRADASSKVCPACNGSAFTECKGGWNHYHRYPCLTCEGTGKIKAQPQPRPQCGTCDQWVLRSYSADTCPIVPNRGQVASNSDACLHHQDFAAWRESRRGK